MTLIKISQPYAPFSHRLGVKVWLPHSKYGVQVFENRIRIYHSFNSVITLATIQFNFQTLLKPITIFQDLEKGLIKIYGVSEKGYFQYQLQAINPELISLYLIKNITLTEEITCPFILLNASLEKNFHSLEKLSFGITKKAEWENVLKRGLPQEILPFWFLAAQLVPTHFFPYLKTFALNILEGPLFLKQFHSFFEDLFSVKENLQALVQGYKQIRAFFLVEEEGKLIFLPNSSFFACGRLLNIKTSYGILNLEWTKFTLRRIQLKTSKEIPKVCSIHCIFPKKLKKFRLSTPSQQSFLELPLRSPLDLSSESEYLFDRFSD